MSQEKNPNTYKCDACNRAIPPDPNENDHTGSRFEIVPSLSLRHTHGISTPFRGRERFSTRYTRDLCNQCARVALTAMGFEVVSESERAIREDNTRERQRSDALDAQLRAANDLIARLRKKRRQRR